MENTLPADQRSGGRLLGLLRNNRHYVENFAWLFSDRVIRLVVGVVMAGMVARHLGREGYGTLSYAISVMFFLAPLASVGLHQTVMRELIATPEKAGRLLGTTAALKLIFGSACLVVLCGYAMAFEVGTIRLLIMLVGINLLLDASGAFDTWFESQTKARYVALSLNAAFLIGAVLKVALISLGASVIWFGVVLVIQGAIGMFMKARFFHTAFPNRQGWRWSSEMVRPLLVGGLPIIMLMVNLSLMKRLDIFMLKKMGGLAETGVYASATLLSDALFIVPALIAGTVLPGLMRMRESNRARYQKSIAAYFRLNAFLGYIGAIGFFILTPLVLPLIFGERFAAATPMAQILGISAIPLFLATSRQDYLFAEGKASSLVGVGLVALAVNIGLNIWLIPTLGGIGAAWATVASYFVYAVVGSFFHRSTCWVGRMQLLALLKPWPGAAIASAIAKPSADEEGDNNGSDQRL